MLNIKFRTAVTQSQTASPRTDKNLWSLSRNQTALLGLFGALVVYLAVRQPSLTAIGGSGAFVTAGCLLLNPLLKLLLRYQRSYWLMGGLVTATVLLGTGPVSAQFFNALEEATTEVVTASDSGIDEGVITGIFTLFRVLVVLAFIAGVVGMLVQAFRGGDWQPIASMIGIGLAFVIGVEIITNLMLGGAGGAGAGGAGA